MKSLSRTQWNYLPKGSKNCTNESGYVPDTQMEVLINEKAGCIPKWSTLDRNRWKTCETVTDFENYLKASSESQGLINQLPKQCVLETWKSSQFLEHTSIENTSLQISLLSMNPEVNFPQIKNVKITKIHSIS